MESVLEMGHDHWYLPGDASDAPAVLSRAGLAQIGKYLALRDHSLPPLEVYVAAGWIEAEIVGVHVVDRFGKVDRRKNCRPN